MPRSLSRTCLVIAAYFLFCLSASSTFAFANAFATHGATSSTSPSSIGKVHAPRLLHKQHQQQQPLKQISPISHNVMSNAKAGGTALQTKGGDAPPPAKRIRIDAFDSARFFLIAFIATGHFIRFAHPSPLVMKFFAQVNVAVGAFFVLSGYVTAYTSSTVGAYEASPKLKPAPAWILPRIFGYFPLHVILLAVFSPVFLYADVTYNGWLQSAIHGIMSLTMTQAWFPMHAEVWNAPTWFLSALTFATAIMPFALKPLCNMTKSQLRKVVGYLTLASLLPKLGYCYDHNAWGVMEGIMAPKAFANLAIFNTQRFNPLINMLEVVLGAAACRLVMLDGVEDPNDKTAEKAVPVNLMSTLLPVIGMVGILLLRAMEVVKLNDLLTRTLIFLPLFLKFLMATHRVAVKNAVNGTKENFVVQALSSKLLVALGGLSFPIFLVHGPLGQVFYKKIIATKLFGGTCDKVYGPWFFGVYLLSVLVSSFVLKKGVMESPTIGSFSKSTANKWAKGL